jgi:hypothetical protein
MTTGRPTRQLIVRRDSGGSSAALHEGGMPNGVAWETVNLFFFFLNQTPDEHSEVVIQ